MSSMISENMFPFCTRIVINSDAKPSKSHSLYSPSGELLFVGSVDQCWDKRYEYEMKYKKNGIQLSLF